MNINDSARFVSGIGKTLVKVNGYFDSVITIDGSDFEDRVFVLPDSALQYQMIIGQTLFSQAIVTIGAKENYVSFVKRDLQETKTEDEVDAINCLMKISVNDADVQCNEEKSDK